MEVNMQKWEYTMRRRVIDGDVTLLWDKKHAYQDGKTEVDVIQIMGEDGWELVDVTPISGNSMFKYGLTTELLFTFKRPKQ
jgi:hypothetical protein